MGYNKERDCWVGYIYCIENIINGKKYIGQTTKTIEKRWTEHKNFAKSNNPYMAFAKALKKYGEKNFNVFELVHVESENRLDIIDKLNELEVFFIKLHNTLANNGHGYNIQIGGNSGRIYNPICSYDMNGNLLKEFFNIADAACYYNICEDVVRRICNGKCGNHKKSIVFRYKHDDFNKYSIERKPYSRYTTKVDAYDANTLEYIGTFKSLSECKKKLDVFGSNILRVCNGIYKQCDGYIFRYHGDPIDKYSTQWEYKHNKSVNQYDENLNYINTYKSAVEASKVTGANSSHINSCCKGKRKTCGGFKWFYANDLFQPDSSKVVAL